MRLDIQNLKSQLKIDQVIRRYIPLVRKGNKAIGFCPFHNDQYPSLQVDLRLQSFTCYACGEHGDAIYFVQKIEGCSFVEASLKLMENYGGTPIVKKTDKTSESIALKKKEIHFNKEKSRPSFIDDFVTEMAFDSTSYTARLPERDSKNLNDYFFSHIQPYEIADSDLASTYRDFRVGKAITPLHDSLRPFEGKIIYPVYDDVGDLYGFVGRNEGQRRGRNAYLSLTHDMKKEDILYGYYQGQEKIQLELAIYIVENFEDVIAMHSAGFINTISICGTFLSETQKERLLKDGVKEVYLLFENDNHGIKAMRKLANALKQYGMKVQIISLPEKETPSSLFQKRGRKDFIEWVEEVTYLPHRIEELLIATCLCYPRAKVFTKDTKYDMDFASFLLKILPIDEVLFVRKRHMALLEYISTMEIYDEETDICQYLPEDIKGLAQTLLIRYSITIKQVSGHYTNHNYQNREESLSRFFLTLVYAYYDIRLYGQINDILLQYRKDPDWADTYTLLASLDDRYEIDDDVYEWIQTLGVN